MDRNPWLWGALVALAVIVAGVALFAASGSGRGASQTPVAAQAPAGGDLDAPLVTRPPASSLIVPGAAPRRGGGTTTRVASGANRAGAPRVDGKKAALEPRASAASTARRPAASSEGDAGDETAGQDASTTPGSGTEAPETAAPAPAAPAPAPSATGVASSVRFQGASWRAASTVTYENPDEDLREIGMTEEGAPIFVRTDAAPPYRAFLIPVPDGDRQFVEFRRQ